MSFINVESELPRHPSAHARLNKARRTGHITERWEKKAQRTLTNRPGIFNKLFNEPSPFAPPEKLPQDKPEKKPWQDGASSLPTVGDLLSKKQKEGIETIRKNLKIQESQVAKSVKKPRR